MVVFRLFLPQSVRKRGTLFVTPDPQIPFGASRKETLEMSIRTIPPGELDRLRRSGAPVELIDVRTPAEYREIHVEYAMNSPLECLDPKAVKASRDGSQDKPLYLICRRGKQSLEACNRFLECGFENVVSVEGGTLACAEQGLPVKRGRKAISLECQVRITAGLLVLLGVLLGLSISPYFTLLSALVGGGLVYAGLTDRCPMAKWLAKMPWNQVRCSATGDCAEQATASCCPRNS
jgi:rhodanese-related sulfurtransferase